MHVESWCDPPEQLLDFPEWQLTIPARPARTARVLQGRRQGDHLVVQLEGVESREDAAQWVGWVIEIDRARLPPTAEREYYRADLIGCIVTNEQDVELGVVDHFVEAAGNAVMVVKGEREHWVPASPEHLLKVDLAARRIRVDWPDDL